MIAIPSIKKTASISGILILLLLGVNSCQEKKADKVSALYEILSGQWKMTDQDVIESWEFNGNFLEGVVLEISGKDTIVTEELKIMEKDGAIYYEPTVKNQNEGKAISFKLIQSENNKWIFENQAHDFPQQIEYNFITNDSLLASIKGELIGEMKTIEFIYIRIE